MNRAQQVNDLKNINGHRLTKGISCLWRIGYPKNSIGLK